MIYYITYIICNCGWLPRENPIFASSGRGTCVFVFPSRSQVGSRSPARVQGLPWLALWSWWSCSLERRRWVCNGESIVFLGVVIVVDIWCIIVYSVSYIYIYIYMYIHACMHTYRHTYIHTAIINHKHKYAVVFLDIYWFIDNGG